MLMRCVVPVYEFYCADCHTIFKFLSRRVNTEKSPACPQCGRPELDRQISIFAISKGASKDAEGDDDGAAFVSDNSLLAVLHLTVATNAQSCNGKLYDIDHYGDADDNWETTLRTLANDVYSAINEVGDIRATIEI